MFDEDESDEQLTDNNTVNENVIITPAVNTQITLLLTNLHKL